MDNMFLHLRNGRRGGGCSEQYDLFSIFGSLFDAAYLLPGPPRPSQAHRNTNPVSFSLIRFSPSLYGSSQLSSKFYIIYQDIQNWAGVEIRRVVNYTTLGPPFFLSLLYV